MYPSRSAGTKPLFESRENPPEHYLVAHSDGGARGNPGPAGYGVVIKDETGRKVAALSEYLGHQTNNFAEYQGLIAALEYALKHGPKALKLISDSELLVRQIKGIYKVKNATAAGSARPRQGIDRATRLVLDRPRLPRTKPGSGPTGQRGHGQRHGAKQCPCGRGPCGALGPRGLRTSRSRNSKAWSARAKWNC